MPNRDALVGTILGTAVGDAIGLPYEGLSRRRGRRLLGEPDRHRLFFGRGMVSDDTEHACMTAQAVIAAGDDPDAFARQLARRLKLWLLAMPAGTGLATLKATLRLWLGVRPDRSGVRSAGNGPVMRSPVLGAAIDDLDLLKRFVRASTRITHTDPRAEHGALAVALAAHMAARVPAVDGSDYLRELRRLLAGEPADELVVLAERAVQGVQSHASTLDFAASLNLKRGVSGYVYHTVPVVLHAWLRHPRDFRSAVTDVVCCGGDTDSTAAIVGGIVGSAVGQEGIPPEWLNGLLEWPRTVRWMEGLAVQLFDARLGSVPARPLRLPAYGILPRNLLFLSVVLVHGFRRLFPPY